MRASKGMTWRLLIASLPMLALLWFFPVPDLAFRPIANDGSAVQYRGSIRLPLALPDECMGASEQQRRLDEGTYLNEVLSRARRRDDRCIEALRTGYAARQVVDRCGADCEAFAPYHDAFLRDYGESLYR